jgi:hypothetical protein
MRDYLTFIASDEMEGRDTPSRGLDTTAKFLAMNLARWGLKPAGDDGTFFQRIELRRNRTDTGQTKVDINGRALTNGTDYLPLGAGNVSGPLVFAGSGWFLKSKDIDAYKGVDPAGRIAVIAGAPNMRPRGISREDQGKYGEDSMNPVDYARSKGVAGLIYVPDSQYLANWRSSQRIIQRGSTVVAKFQPQQSTQPPSLPSIVLSPEVANGIFEGEAQTGPTIFNVSTGPTPVTPFLLSDQKKISLNIASNVETLSTQNVIAVWSRR